MSTSLRWALAGALVLHAGALVAVLAGTATPALPNGSAGANNSPAAHLLARHAPLRAGARAQAMQVRWVPASPPPQGTPSDTPAPQLAESLTAASPQAATAAHTLEAATDAYLPRSQLSKAPQALDAIHIPFPEGVPGGQHYSAVLALYVDETGTVRKVVVQSAEAGSVEARDQPLPPPLAQAARLAFMQAGFAPGELKGRAVKALIHVEVQFDDRDPLDTSRSIGGLAGNHTL